MFTCVIRYEVNPCEIEAFLEYAHNWMELIEKYGGKHHGYFLPPFLEEQREQLPEATFSFPDIGNQAPPNSGFALFSFNSLEDYESYRREVKNDSQSEKMKNLLEKTLCFKNYERSFTIPVFPQS